MNLEETEDKNELDEELRCSFGNKISNIKIRSNIITIYAIIEANRFEDSSTVV